MTTTRTFQTTLGAATAVAVIYVSLTEGETIRFNVPLNRQGTLAHELSELALRAVYSRAHHARPFTCRVLLTAPNGTLTDVTRLALEIGLVARFPDGANGPAEWRAAVADAVRDVAAGLPIPPVPEGEDEDDVTPPPVPAIDPELLAAIADAASNFTTLDHAAYHERKRLERLTPDELLAEADGHLRRLTERRLARDKPGAAAAATAAAMALEFLSRAPVEDVPTEPDQADGGDMFDRIFFDAVTERGVGALLLQTGQRAASARYFWAAARTLQLLSYNLQPPTYVPVPDENGDIPF